MSPAREIVIELRLFGPPPLGPCAPGGPCAPLGPLAPCAPTLGETAMVYDHSPNFDQTYRFRFYVDPTNVATTGLTSLTQVAIFGAHSNLNHGTVKANNQMVQLYFLGDGSGAVKLRTYAACSSGDNFLANRCRASSDLTLPKPFTGGVRIEGQLIVGTTGTGKVNIWIGSNVNTGTPDATINVDNSAWYSAGTEGVKSANFGLFAPSAPFETLETGLGANAAVLFDEFDSHRQTFIGL